MKNNSVLQAAYKQLNTRQTQAVTTIDGPVLVLAGPGTGKTQVLTLRIAEILKRTQMNPANILCLTFTESASTEMKKRLVKFIGSAAYDVRITTFHSFANSIIQDFAYKFGSSLEEDELNFVDLNQIDDLDRFNLLSRLLIQKKWDYIKPFKKPLYYLSEVSKSIADIKRERINPRELVATCKSLIEANKNETEKTDSTLVNKLNRTIELAQLFTGYQKELEEQKKYDYEDMINWVVDKLKDDPELALIYQEKFQYILVDEYQDTNTSQLELLNQITSFFKNPNLFVVGDPNQSIYRFQGASTKNISDFTHKYPNSEIINLIDNYRNPQTILDSAFALIIHNPDSQQFINEKLMAKKDKKNKLSINTYSTTDQETQAIAESIRKEIAQGRKPSEIAILVRKNAQIDKYVRALDELNVPSQITKGESVLFNPFIERVLTLLEFLLDPNDWLLFSRVLFYFRERISLQDANALSKIGPDKSFNQLARVSKKDHQISMETRGFLLILLDLSQKISQFRTPQIIERVIQKMRILEDLNDRPNRIIQLEALKSLLSNSKDNKDLDLSVWLKTLRSRKEYNIDLVSESILYGREVAVVIATIHQAKGKEYELVYLPEMEEQIWSNHKSSYFYFPMFNQDKKLTKEDDIAEQRRLFYVALTRTKENCFISHAKLNSQKSLLESRFIEELPKELIVFKESQESEADILRRTEQSLLPVPLSHLSNKEEAWLKELVGTRALSPTGFCTYLKCPKNFFLKNILRIPSVKTKNLAYGTAIHKALEEYFLKYKNTNSKPSENDLINAFTNALENEIITKLEKEELINNGTKLLHNYYQNKSAEFVKPVNTEFRFGNHIHLDGIPLSGQIDKIEWVNQAQKTVRVIDYKTGRVKSRNALLGKTQNPDEDYIFQLKFYSVLAKLDKRFDINWQITESQLQFLDEDGKFNQETFNFTGSEIEDFKKQIKKVWQDIQDLKFPHKTNSAFGCEYCNLINL